MIIGTSLGIRRVLHLVEQVAPTTASVLITGESGTGKELLARRIHELSPRHDRPFIAINCAASSESLIESDLFGHERGAFTGADRRREGCFERANTGTLLLDEITEMRLEAQAKLLRALQEREFLRVGGSKEIRFDVRVLAASNRPPLGAMREGRFRRDLFYRLNGFPIGIPPLRDRVEDIPLLVEHFIREFNRDLHRNVQRIEPAFLDVLKAQRWDGNVRELENVVRYAVILCRSSMVSMRDLRPDLIHSTSGESSFATRLGQPLADVQREYIARTLMLFGGNKRRAADALGIGRTKLYALLRRYRAHTVNGRLNGRAHRNGRSGSGSGAFGDQKL
jgi:transcriptional regulator with PAS, ATPase and Fis domain